MNQTEQEKAPLQDYMQSQRSSQLKGQALNPIDDVPAYLMKFAKQQPQTAALWCFGIGFVVGWKLKPW